MLNLSNHRLKSIKFITLTFFFATGTFALIVALTIFTPDAENYFNRIEFDREQWINWEETETTASLRWNMVHDLTTEHKLLGMTRSEVIELLGPPDDEFEIKGSIYYYLGMAGYGIDTGTLMIKFKDDTVIDYKVSHG